MRDPVCGAVLDEKTAKINWKGETIYGIPFTVFSLSIRCVQFKASLVERLTAPWLMIKAFWRHFLLRQSFDKISEENGLSLINECIHMNSRGGTTIADQIEAFLQIHSIELCKRDCSYLAGFDFSAFF